MGFVGFVRFERLVRFNVFKRFNEFKRLEAFPITSFLVYKKLRVFAPSCLSVSIPSSIGAGFQTGVYERFQSQTEF